MAQRNTSHLPRHNFHYINNVHVSIPGISWLNLIWGPRSSIYIFSCIWVSKVCVFLLGTGNTDILPPQLGSQKFSPVAELSPISIIIPRLLNSLKKALKCQPGTHGRLSLFQTFIVYFLINGSHTRAWMIFKSSIKYLSEGKNSVKKFHLNHMLKSTMILDSQF